MLSLFLVAMANPTPNPNLQTRAVLDGMAKFSSNFYRAVAEEKSGNLVSSPLSAAFALSMLGYGAQGQTTELFKNTLHLPEEAVAKSGFQNLIDQFNNVENVEMKIANNVFLNVKADIKPTYKELMETYFRSANELVDFADPEKAATTINTWVKNQTNDRIKELFTAGDLTPATVLVLANAVYFKGQWKLKFHPELTQDLPFHVDKDTVKNVPTMYMEKEFKYGELPQLNAKFVELPYKGDEFSMIIILPNEIDGLAQVEENLKGKNLGDVLNGDKIEVTLLLPKFKIESSIDLSQSLTKLGLGGIFENNANFSGISDVPLKVSKAIQKAFIEVNEEGSEAAAATGIGIVAFSLPITKYFKVDHPFFYSIVKTQTDESGDKQIIPIFSGRVTDP